MVNLLLASGAAIIGAATGVFGRDLIINKTVVVDATDLSDPKVVLQPKREKKKKEDNKEVKQVEKVEEKVDKADQESPQEEDVVEAEVTIEKVEGEVVENAEKVESAAEPETVSEPEKPGVEMVEKTSMNKVKELDNLYEKFYYAELPKFHSKNVIEYKGGVTSLYTGSFNILSFSIHGHEEHFRMEQMSFANKQSAEKMRKDYLNRFAQKYVNEYANKMIKSPNKSDIDFSKIKYLKTIEDINTTISRLDDIAKEANIQIKYKEFPNDNILVKIAESILKRKYIPNNIELQYQLSASLFLYDLGRTKKKNEYCDMAIRKIEELLSRNSIYDICQFVIIKSKDGNSKITINIICNGFYFEFADIIIKMAVFNSVSKHNVNFNFKENHIIEAKYKIRNLLYNASRSIKVQDGDK